MLIKLKILYFYQKKKELEAQKRISIKMSQFRHNYNARVVGTISLLEEVMKRMKTILAVAGLIWVMSHGFPILKGSKFVVL